MCFKLHVKFSTLVWVQNHWDSGRNTGLRKKGDLCDIIRGPLGGMGCKEKWGGGCRGHPGKHINEPLLPLGCLLVFSFLRCLWTQHSPSQFSLAVAPYCLYSKSHHLVSKAPWPAPPLSFLPSAPPPADRAAQITAAFSCFSAPSREKVGFPSSC